jgi:hypothetical protein
VTDDAGGHDAIAAVEPGVQAAPNQVPVAPPARVIQAPGSLTPPEFYQQPRSVVVQPPPPVQAAEALDVTEAPDVAGSGTDQATTSVLSVGAELGAVTHDADAADASPPPFPPRTIQQPQRRLPPRQQYQQRRPTMVPPDSTAVGPYATQTQSPSLDAGASGESDVAEIDAPADQAAQRLIVIKTEKLVGWLTIALDENSRLHRELLDAHADIDWLRRENQQLRDAMASDRPWLVRAVVGAVSAFLLSYTASVAGNVTTNSLVDARNERPAAATAADFVRQCREVEALIPPPPPAP